MKKHISVIAVMLALLMLLPLAACSEKSTDLADYDLEKFVNLCEYKGVKITHTVFNVTDDDVASEVEAFLEGFAETVTLDEDDILQLYDEISVTYVGKVNGEYDELENGYEFANTEGNTDTFVIGGGGYIPGFQEAFIGYHPGDEFEFDITFPEGYTNNPALSGVNTIFSGTIVSASRDVTPEYTDEFVAKNTEYATIEEFEEHLREELRAEADEKELLEDVSAVWTKIMDDSEVLDYPEAVVKARLEESMNTFEQSAQYYGMTLEDLVSVMYGMSLEEFESALETQCRQLVFEEMVLNLIVQREGITISDAEYTEGLANYAQTNGADDVKEFEAEYGEDTIRESLLWDKVLMFLVEKAEITDTVNGDADTVTE